jgi:hypothetical protein
MDKENGNQKRSTKGKVAIERVHMGRSRGKKRKEKGKSYRGNNNRSEIGQEKGEEEGCMEIKVHIGNKWCKLNRFRTGHGKCNNMLFHWNIRENPSCECGAEKETIQHIVEECPLTKFQQGFSKLHLLTEDALNWLQQIKNI